MNVAALLFNATMRMFGSPRRFMFCPRCYRPHIDLDEWALRPHRTHLCTICGNKWVFDSKLKTVGI